MAGDIYINNLLTDLQTAETEGQELQKEFDWILTLPPSAFASQEMLDWLTDPNTMEISDQIEKVNKKMFEKLISRNEFLTVFFCKYDF